MILQGDALTWLKQINDNTVDCCVTSPPYWGLRDYKTEGFVWGGKEGCTHEWQETVQKWHNDTSKRIDSVSKYVYDETFRWIGTQSAYCSKCNAWRGSLGLEPTFQEYLDHLIQIFAEVKRVVKPTGAVWVNIGDTYAGNKGEMRNPGFGGNAQKGYQYAKEAIGRKRYDVYGAPVKSLLGIPERFKIRMIDELGLICRNTIIWYKPNCMPSSAKDRFTVDFEYLYFFTKSPRYYFETQYESYQTADITSASYRKNGKSDSRVKDKLGGGGCPAFGNRGFWKPEGLGRLKRCVWRVSTKPFSGAHFAVFPPDLITTPIKATCPKGGIVLDPFAGASTTGLVALQQRKHFIGIEISEPYIAIAKARLMPLLRQQTL